MEEKKKEKSRNEGSSSITNRASTTAEKFSTFCTSSGDLIMMMQGFLICRILGGGVGSIEPALGSSYAVPAAMLPQPLSLPTPAPAASAQGGQAAEGGHI